MRAKSGVLLKSAVSDRRRTGPFVILPFMILSSFSRSFSPAAH